MRNFIKRTALVMTLSCAAGITSFVLVRNVRSQTTSANQPYTVWLYQTVKDSKSTRAEEKSLFAARRGDGSTSKGSVWVHPDGQRYMTRSVKSIPDRKRTAIYDSIHSISTEFLPDAILRRKEHHSDPTCTIKHGDPNRYIVIGRDTLLGVDVVKLEFKDDAAGLRVEQWEAPSLGCAEVRFVAEWRNPTGDLLSREERIATSIQLGEPAGDLFTIPSGYAEVPPSRIVNSLAKKFHGGECPECVATEKWARVDKRYHDSRQYAPR